MITSFKYVLVAVLFDPALNLPLEYAILDYYNTKQECYIEKNAQPYAVNVRYFCVKRDST